ncbi:hypothetical protein M8J76_001395 [Diaphorina citri]|nr:hypothetical protein M8J76_001395 [Diaphorina citri]
MEEAVQQLEESAKSADERISKINTKLEMTGLIKGTVTTFYSSLVSHSIIFHPVLFLSLLCLIFQVSVLGLLQDVNQVKTECEDLKQELGRVHELKTQISKDMQSQVYVVNDLFAQLRSKIINHANNLQAVSKK